MVGVRFVHGFENAWMLWRRQCILCGAGLHVVPVKWNGREYRVLYCPVCDAVYVPPRMPEQVYQQAIAAIEKAMITIKG